MSQVTQWCSMCKAGATKEVTRTHYWCTNCGCVFDEHGVCRGIPTKIGPDPRERRDAWDQYAANYQGKTGEAAVYAAKHADTLLKERDSRFSPNPQEPTNG